MFIHNAPIEIPDFKLKISNENGTRFYLTEDGNKYPSITSVLSANPEKQKGLQKWRQRVGREEATKISGRAARRGTVVHKICEDYLNNEEDYSNGAMPDSLEMFNSLKPILDKNLNNIHSHNMLLNKSIHHRNLGAHLLESGLNRLFEPRGSNKQYRN